MPNRIINSICSKSQISFTKLTAYIALIIVAASIAVIFIGAGIIRDKAIHDLARQEAKQTSQFVFQSLYSAMSKGWTKDEIKDIVKRLNSVQPNMEIIVVRGEPVIRQFGEIPGEKELMEKDPMLMKALKGEDILLKNDILLKYYYPVIVQKECLKCHNKAKEGDINGVIKVTYPIQNLKVSLDFLINAGVISFVVFMIVTLSLFYLAVKRFLISPILNLVNVISGIATEA
ncbi:MAG: signal transduction protein, partial [Deltaproteobacteria bacterium]|nr:signal transduction protein [Deltaproteobacteria bacterium]